MPVLRTLVASLACAAAGLGALAVATDGFTAYTSETARRQAVRAHPRVLPPLALQDDAGTATTLAAWRGRWLLVDFIYTRCDTYCSVLGGEFAQLQEQLAEPIAQGRVGLLSISFDPSHDDPAALRAYRQRFGDHGAGWTAARPADDLALAALRRDFGLKAVPDGLGGWVHNAAIAVIDPQGRLVDLLDAGESRATAQALRARIAA